MSDKSNDNGKKYTVDDILEEFRQKRSNSTGSNNEADINGELNADPDTDEAYSNSAEDGEAEPQELESLPEPAKVLTGVTPAEVFGVDRSNETAEKLFGGEAPVGSEAYVTDSESSGALPDTELREENSSAPEADVWEESAEASAEIPDEAIFKEELEEEAVSDEKPEKEAAPAPVSGANAGKSENVTDVENSKKGVGGADAGKSENVTDVGNSENGSKEIISLSAEEAAAEKAPEKSSAQEKDNTESNISSDINDKENLSREKASENNTESNNTPEFYEDKKSFWQGIIPCKGDKVSEIIRKIVFIAAVAVFIGAGVMLATTLRDSSQALEDAEEIKSIVTTTVATTVDSDGSVITIAPTEEEKIEHNVNVMEYYKAISENVIGFIELEGCGIYYPVVQGEDNDYYLTRTYYDETNKGGAIYADHRCVFREDYTSPNVVIYGHNQEDGTMFGNLKSYKQNLEFYAANPTVTFNTEYGVGTYLIYGFFVTNALEKQDSNGEVFHYHDYIETMNDEATFNWYLDEVQERNQIISPVEVKFGDSLLCLSTCSNEFSDSRFVVFARKLREGESVSDYDFSETRFNPYARGVDWTAILSGDTTATTVPEETTRKKKTNLAQTSAPEESEETASKKKKKKTVTEAAETELSAENSETVTEVPEEFTEAPVTETATVNNE